VKQTYNALENTIKHLGESLSGILVQQETEFLSAYKAHIHSVRKQFKALRDEADERERAVTENEYVKKLEHERNWYREEALNLDKLLTSSKLSEKKLLGRVSELEEECKWHATQLKNEMKQKLIKRETLRKE